MHMTDDEALARADALLEAMDQTRNDLEGQQVRVVRAVVYEGEGLAVLAQLTRSLPIGTSTPGMVTITIVQGPLDL